MPETSSAAAPGQGLYARFKNAAKKLKREVLAVYYAMQDGRTAWYAKFIMFVVIMYAVSPLDLIPDFIPVLGIIDDLILLPALILLAIRMIPAQVMVDARQRADNEPLRLSRSWACASFVFIIWMASLSALTWYLAKRYGNEDVIVYTPWGLAAAGLLCSIIFIVWVIYEVKKDKAKHNRQAAAVQADAEVTTHEEAGACVEGDEEAGLTQPLMSNNETENI